MLAPAIRGDRHPRRDRRRRCTHRPHDYFDTTNYSDVAVAWKVGGGARVRVHDGRHPVALDFGVGRHQNGIANFLTEGDIFDYADGTIRLLPNRSEANLVTFRFGVSTGVGN
jgi:hypothetical protein